MKDYKIEEEVKETKTVTLEDNKSFRDGAKAMFDFFMGWSANNWHVNWEMQKLCVKENELIEGLATDALNSVSPEDADNWKSLSVATMRIKELEDLLIASENKNKKFWMKSIFGIN
jgi:hypothetical protein